MKVDFVLHNPSVIPTDDTLYNGQALYRVRGLSADEYFAVVDYDFNDYMESHMFEQDYGSEPSVEACTEIEAAIKRQFGKWHQARSIELVALGGMAFSYLGKPFLLEAAAPLIPEDIAEEAYNRAETNQEWIEIIADMLSERGESFPPYDGGAW